MSSDANESAHEEDMLEVEIIYRSYADDVIKMDMEDVHNQSDNSDESYIDSGPFPNSSSSRKFPSKVPALPYAEDLIECLLDRFRTIKRNDPELPVLSQKGGIIKSRGRSWINKDIRRILQKREYYPLRCSNMLPLVPYAVMKPPSSRNSAQYRLLNQFGYVAMAGVYWAGLKACSGNTLTLADILPFMIVDNDEPQSPKVQKTWINGTRIVTIRRTGSCASRVSAPIHSRVFAWILTHMAQYWCSARANEKHHIASIKRYIRFSRNHVALTMLAKPASTDFMLINVPQSQLNISIDRLYGNWHKLYAAGLSLNNRLWTRDQDTFNSKDMALYADYIVRGNHFTRLITAYPDVGVFVDNYFKFFRS